MPDLRSKEALEELESLKVVKPNFTVGKKVKRIKFGRIEGLSVHTGEVTQLKVLEGEYLGSKKFGKMSGRFGDTFYKVKVVFNEEEFRTYQVPREEVIELFES